MLAHRKIAARHIHHSPNAIMRAGYAGALQRAKTAAAMLRRFYRVAEAVNYRGCQSVSIIYTNKRNWLDCAIDMDRVVSTMRPDKRTAFVVTKPDQNNLAYYKYRQF